MESQTLTGAAAQSKSPIHRRVSEDMVVVGRQATKGGGSPFEGALSQNPTRLIAQKSRRSLSDPRPHSQSIGTSFCRCLAPVHVVCNGVSESELRRCTRWRWMGSCMTR